MKAACGAWRLARLGSDMARPAPLPLFPVRGKPRILTPRKPAPPEGDRAADGGRPCVAPAVPAGMAVVAFSGGELRDAATAGKLKAMGCNLAGQTSC